MHYLGYPVNTVSFPLLWLLSTLHVCFIVGISPLDTSTDVTLQDNPSYTAVEEEVTLEPNPCYSAAQASSAHESICGHGEDQKTGFEFSVSTYFIL